MQGRLWRLARSAVATVPLVWTPAVVAQAVSVSVNGVALPTCPPVLQRDGVVLAPCRLLLQALGAEEIAWAAETRTIVARHGHTSVEMTIGSRRLRSADRSSQDTAFYSGLEGPTVMGARAELTGDRAYVPLGAAAESLHAHVRWDGAHGSVEISLPGAQPERASESGEAPGS